MTLTLIENMLGNRGRFSHIGKIFWRELQKRDIGIYRSGPQGGSITIVLLRGNSMAPVRWSKTKTAEIVIPQKARMIEGEKS